MNAEELIDAVTKGVELEDELTFANDTEYCLWLMGVGKWDASHDIVESLPEPGASWIHAMLHRDEGDLGNAGYWYHRANKQMPLESVSIQDEWASIVKSLLK